MSAVRVDLAGFDAGPLTALVESFSGFVGRCHQQRLLASGAKFPPAIDAGSFHLRDRAAVEPAVGLIDLRNRDVTTSQTKAGLSFPFLVEPVGMVEFDCAEGVDEQTEHATASDSGELQWVADQREPPALQVREGSQLGELGRCHHRSLVHDHRRPRPEGRSGDRAAGRAGVR